MLTISRYRYHKQHGHQTQRLHENGDGTFSIVDPETESPYPGTMGVELEKPYKCEVCTKRYKNLNGLKYVSSSAPASNPATDESSLLTWTTAQGSQPLLRPGEAGSGGQGDARKGSRRSTGRRPASSSCPVLPRPISHRHQRPRLGKHRRRLRDAVGAPLIGFFRLVF